MRNTLNFLLNDWLQADHLATRPRFSDHSQETFNAVLDTCEKIAREKFAPFNRIADTEEPRFDGEKVILPRSTHKAMAAYVESGMLAAAQDYENGGMQLPYVIEAAANAFFAKAAVSMGYGMLTTGNANLLMAHGTELQKAVFAANEFSGRWFGTMCLSEPQAGSSLSDVVTRAVPDGDNYADDLLGSRYRLRGNKMWISGGEHEMSENIIHLVLAKIPDENGKLITGTKGISLFIVPKFLVELAAPSPLPGATRLQASVASAGVSQTVDSSLPAFRPARGEGAKLGERNDVALAGLNHKLGWRGTTNCLLNFGEGKFTPRSPGGEHGKAGAIGYLVGKPGDGLRCMFHMMNEARIGVGMAATMLGFAGYEASLDYAKQRPQGRVITTSGKQADQPQVRIIEHSDVKRMLLAQKAYCEGALALELYCARLVDEVHTGEAESAAEASLLLEMLTPIAKSWPSEWCLEANSLAIQIHGGYGYTRDFPVEQYWRDNRLNMIHEGTHGIQALDLLGRKVVMQEGKGLKLLASKIMQTVQRAQAIPALKGHADDLQSALNNVALATQAAWSTNNPAEALANAVPYMQAFGHMIIAWIWLDVVLVAEHKEYTANRIVPLASVSCSQTCKYFYHYELPKMEAWLKVVSSRDITCAAFPEEAF